MPAHLDFARYERDFLHVQQFKTLDDLPADGREVIRLMHLEGYTVEAAAARLGLPVGTVKSRSHRAHKRLVAVLQHLRAPVEAAVA